MRPIVGTVATASTVTFSLKGATSSTASTVRRLAATVSDCACNVKPGAEISRRYSPGARPSNWYVPLAPVISVLWSPDGTCMSTTGAPTTCLLYTSDAADERSSVDLG